MDDIQQLTNNDNLSAALMLDLSAAYSVLSYNSLLFKQKPLKKGNSVSDYFVLN